MENFIKALKSSVKHWYLYLILGVVFLLTGFWVISKPAESYAALSIVFSITFLIAGISHLILSVEGIRTSGNWGWNMAYGIVLLILGIYLIGSPSLSKEALAIYVGFISLLFSISALVFATDLKALGSRQWGWLLALGILSVIFSVFLLINPLFAGLTVVIYTAFSFFSLGVFYITYSFRLRKVMKMVQKIPESLKERYDSLLLEFRNHFSDFI